MWPGIPATYFWYTSHMTTIFTYQTPISHAVLCHGKRNVCCIVCWNVAQCTRHRRVNLVWSDVAVDGECKKSHAALNVGILAVFHADEMLTSVSAQSHRRLTKLDFSLISSQLFDSKVAHSLVFITALRTSINQNKAKRLTIIWYNCH